MARRRALGSWARAGRWRRTRDAYRVQGCMLNVVTLFAMFAGLASCGATIAASESVLLGFIVGVGVYFFFATRGYNRITGGE